MAETVNGTLWGGLALAEVDGRVGVMGAWLLNACGGSSIGALINGGLHLFEELVNVHQVVLGSQVGQREGILVLWHVSAVVASMAVNRNKRWTCLDILGDTATMDWNSLKGHQSLSNLSI